MMLEPPENLAASYTLVPPIDIDKLEAVSEWSKESSCGLIKHVGFLHLTNITSCMLISVILPVCTWERTEECRPAVSAPLMELERDSVGVEEAEGSTIERVMDFRSWRTNNTCCCPEPVTSALAVKLNLICWGKKKQNIFIQLKFVCSDHNFHAFSITARLYSQLYMNVLFSLFLMSLKPSPSPFLSAPLAPRRTSSSLAPPSSSPSLTGCLAAASGEKQVDELEEDDSKTKHTKTKKGTFSFFVSSSTLVCSPRKFSSSTCSL